MNFCLGLVFRFFVSDDDGCGDGESDGINSIDRMSVVPTAL